jgi:hypothetical protein
MTAMLLNIHLGYSIPKPPAVINNTSAVVEDHRMNLNKLSILALVTVIKRF